MREIINQLRADIDEALAAVAKKHGLSTLQAGKATIGPDRCTIAIEAIREGGQSKEASRYDAHKKSLGLPPLGTEVNTGKDIYIPTGLNSTGSKVIVTKKANDKSYLYATETFAMFWKMQQKEAVAV